MTPMRIGEQLLQIEVADFAVVYLIECGLEFSFD
jgi:hypothetical protein